MSEYEIVPIPDRQRSPGRAWQEMLDAVEAHPGQAVKLELGSSSLKGIRERISVMGRLRGLRVHCSIRDGFAWLWIDAPNGKPPEAA